MRWLLVTLFIELSSPAHATVPFLPGSTASVSPILDGSVALKGAQAVTVTFNQSVIPLGTVATEPPWLLVGCPALQYKVKFNYIIVFSPFMQTNPSLEQDASSVIIPTQSISILSSKSSALIGLVALNLRSPH